MKKMQNKIYLIPIILLTGCLVLTPAKSGAVGFRLLTKTSAIPQALAAPDINYPLNILITADKTTVFSDGADLVNLTVKITDVNGLGVKNINVKFDSKSGRDIITPSEATTLSDGIVRFKVKSNQEHISTFKFSLKNSKTGEIYSSNAVQISFLNQSRFSKTLASVSDFRASATTQNAVNYVVTPVVTVGAAAGLSSSIINFVNSFFPYLNYLINLLLQLLGIRRKEKPWGTIYDSMTKEPIDLAIIRLFDAKKKNLVETLVTDKSGRFGFSSLAGRYYLAVTKSDYIFPSKLLGDTKIDGDYHNLYYGENINLNKSERLNISIPIDQRTAIEARLSLKDRIKSLSEKLSLPVLIISLLLALFALWVSLTLFNEVLVILYVLIIIFRKKTAKLSTENWGIVFDRKTLKKISGIPIKVLDKKYNKMLETQISDKRGRFGFILPKGEYYLRIDSLRYGLAKKSREIDDSKNYYGESFKVEDNEVLRFNIPVRKN